MKAKLKKQQEEEAQLLRQIYQTVETTKTVKVEDKEVKVKVCPFFRSGMCQKGRKCKLSHELAAKTEELDLYTDQRNQIGDTIDKWDEQKLKEVVA